MRRTFVNIQGNVGKDIEILESKKGNRYGVFSVAVNDGRDIGPDWYNVFVFGSGEQLLKYKEMVKRGNLLNLYGFEEVESYTDKQGDYAISKTLSILNKLCSLHLISEKSVPGKELAGTPDNSTSE